MADSAQRVWKCPSCDRRVPASVDTCRCGTHRSQAVAQVARQEIAKRRRSLPKELWLGVVVMIATLLVLAWRIVRPPPEQPIVPLLGTTAEAERNAASKAAPKPK